MARNGSDRGNTLPRIPLLVWVGARSRTRAPDSQPKESSSFAWGALAHPRTLGHPPTAGSCPPDLAEALQSCLGSAGSVVNTGEGFSYLRVTSHSPSCQQPKEPSTCRLQISAKLKSKCVSLHWSPNRQRELQRTV